MAQSSQSDAPAQTMYHVCSFDSEVVALCAQSRTLAIDVRLDGLAGLVFGPELKTDCLHLADDPFAPMSDRAHDDWWFRGYPKTVSLTSYDRVRAQHSMQAPFTGGEVFDLVAGSTVSTEIVRTLRTVLLL